MKEELIKGTFPPHKLLCDYVTDTNIVALNWEGSLTSLDETEATGSTENGISAKVQINCPLGPTDRKSINVNTENVQENVGQSITKKPGLNADVAKRKNHNKQHVNNKGETSSTSHQRVSRPKRHIRKPNKFSTEYSFKMSKPMPKKKPVVPTSKKNKGIKPTERRLQATTTKQKLQEKPAIKTVGMAIFVLLK